MTTVASSVVQGAARSLASSTSLPPSTVTTALALQVASSTSNYIDNNTTTTPLLSNLLDRLALLSPRTWYGILQSQTQSAFNDFDGRILTKAIVASILPFVVLGYAYANFGSIRQREFLWRLVTPVVALSPWNVAVLHAALVQCRHLYAPLVFYWTGRTKALPTAASTLQERLQIGRAIRRRRYDVYWPPPTPASDEASNSKTFAGGDASSSIRPTKGVLILPGFGIPHLAYSEVASRLSDAGCVVVVVSMEPIRLAHRHLGADVTSMRRILRRVERQMGGSSIQWNLLGHSAGGFAAMHLYSQFQKQQQQQDTASSLCMDKLILWGCAAMVDLSTDLSQLQFVRGNKQILIVQATKDSLVKLMQPQQAAFDAQFPKRHTLTQWIVGGTHQGFASYESTWSGSPQVDSAISYGEQQAQACAKTIDFLWSTTSSTTT